MPHDTLELFTKNNRIIDEHNENFEIEIEELTSHQAKYLCILTSGYLEKNLKEIGKKYIKDGGISNCKKLLFFTVKL
jgi:thioredoxin reductase